jgi:hypothetical protein
LPFSSFQLPLILSFVLFLVLELGDGHACSVPTPRTGPETLAPRDLPANTAGRPVVAHLPQCVTRIGQHSGHEYQRAPHFSKARW